MGFKIGDRVRIISVIEGYEEYIGGIGTIIDVDIYYMYPYEIKFDNIEDNDKDDAICLWKDDELELISEEEEPIDEIKYMDIEEFREKGYLQEVNRQFLHPLGLALEIRIDQEGNEMLGRIWDCRDDEEGIIYHESITSTERFSENIEYIDKEFFNRTGKRWLKHGFVLQRASENKNEKEGRI